MLIPKDLDGYFWVVNQRPVLILKDLEPRRAKSLVRAYSKGFSGFGAEESVEACVYPTAMIPMERRKSREKWKFTEHGPDLIRQLFAQRSTRARHYEY